MAINLKKEEHSKEKAIRFTDDDFADINLDSIRKNERIFISYDKLPDNESERYAYLNSLVSFIDRETGIRCSYVYVNVTMPYEVRGFYIRVAPELTDCDGIYVKAGDTVYDRMYDKWHVSYYCKDNAYHIILDNEKGEYMVVRSLTEFSSRDGYLIPPKFDEDVSEDNFADLTEKSKGSNDCSFHIGKVFISVLVGLALIILVHSGILLFVNILEAARTAAGESDEDLAEKIKTGLEDLNIKELMKITGVTFLACTMINIGIKLIRRMMNRY